MIRLISTTKEIVWMKIISSTSLSLFKIFQCWGKVSSLVVFTMGSWDEHLPFLYFSDHLTVCMCSCCDKSHGIPLWTLPFYMHGQQSASNHMSHTKPASSWLYFCTLSYLSSEAIKLYRSFCSVCLILIYNFSLVWLNYPSITPLSFDTYNSAWRYYLTNYSNKKKKIQTLIVY